MERSEVIRVLVTGSRTWTDYNQVFAQLAGFKCEFGEVTVIHGGAPGADSLADRAARTLGMATEVWRPDWGHCDQSCNHRLHRRADHTTYCPAAGFRRNSKMVESGAHYCVAFLDPCRRVTCAKRKAHPSHGGEDCASKAESAGIDTRRILSLA